MVVEVEVDEMLEFDSTPSAVAVVTAFVDCIGNGAVGPDTVVAAPRTVPAGALRIVADSIVGGQQGSVLQQ